MQSSMNPEQGYDVGKTFSEILSAKIPTGPTCSDVIGNKNFCPYNKDRMCTLFEEKCTDGYRHELCYKNKYLEKGKS